MRQVGVIQEESLEEIKQILERHKKKAQEVEFLALQRVDIPLLSFFHAFDDGIFDDLQGIIEVFAGVSGCHRSAET